MDDNILAFCRDSSATVVAAVFDLPIQQARLLQLVVRANPTARLAQVSDLVGDHYTSIHRLRAALPDGVTIRSQRGVGYTMSPEDKRVMVERFEDALRPVG